MCRIEPENNIHIILEAFSKLTELPLLIVGNWNKSDYGRALKERYASFQNIHLLEPIYEPHTVNWLRSNAALYIHGHSAGGTNPSLVKAMNLGLPVLAFDCVYNRATTEEKCMYWKNAEDLQSAVKEILVVSTGSTTKIKIVGDMKEAGKRLYSLAEDCGAVQRAFVLVIVAAPKAFRSERSEAQEWSAASAERRKARPAVRQETPEKIKSDSFRCPLFCKRIFYFLRVFGQILSQCSLQ